MKLLLTRVRVLLAITLLVIALRRVTLLAIPLLAKRLLRWIRAVPLAVTVLLVIAWPLLWVPLL